MFGGALTSTAAGLDSVFQILSRDSANRRRTSGGDRFVVDIQGAGNVSSSIQDNNDGSYFVSYRTTVAGSYTLSVQLVNYDGSATDIEGSPRTVTVDPNVPSITGSVIQQEDAIVSSALTASNPLYFSVCTPSNWLVRAFDDFANLILDGGAGYQVTLVGGERNIFNYTFSPQDFDNGTYAWRLQMAVSGNFKVKVALDGREISSSPISFQTSYSFTNICNTAIIIIFLVAIVVTSLVYLALIVLVHRYRETWIIRVSSPLFCQILLVGAILVNVTVGIWLAAPSPATCNLSYWVWGLGFSLMFGCLFAKNYRIYFIYTRARKLRMTTISNKLLIVIVGIMTFVHIAVMIIWTAVDASGPSQVRVTTTSDSYLAYLSTRCRQNGVFLGIFYVYKIIFLSAGAVLSILGRKLQSEFNESRHIAFAIYNYTFVIIIQAIFSYSVISDPETDLYLNAAITLIKVALIIIALFAPKFYELWRSSRSKQEGGQSAVQRSRVQYISYMDQSILQKSSSDKNGSTHSAGRSSSGPKDNDSAVVNSARDSQRGSSTRPRKSGQKK
jgi:hypothetical protein